MENSKEFKKRYNKNLKNMYEQLDKVSLVTIKTKVRRRRI